MLKLGDKVNLVYYELGEQVKSPAWLVEEYDNGLLKVTRDPSAFSKAFFEQAGLKPGEKETVVFNLRSVGFLKAELVGQITKRRNKKKSAF